LSAIAATHEREAAAARRQSILLVLFCTISGAAAQILMKRGSHFNPNLLAIVTNIPLMAGYSLYGLNTLLMVLALRKGELSMLYPIIALTYVWVTLLSYTLLHEPPNLFKNCGIGLIVLGVAVLGSGGKSVKE
jgi:multidrug transporter EmrE-like cation transporter